MIVDRLHYRRLLKELCEELRGLRPSERPGFAYEGVPLELEAREMIPLESIRADGSVATAWQKVVVDAIALALVRGDLRKGGVTTEHGVTADAEQARVALREAALGVAADAEEVRRSLGNLGPKLEALLDRALARVEGELAWLDGRSRAAPKEEVEAPRPEERDGEDGPVIESVGDAVASPEESLESFLAEPALALEELVVRRGVDPARIALRTEAGVRSLSALEGKALRRAANPGDEPLSASERLLLLCAALTFWIGRQHGRLEMPDDRDPPSAADMRSDRETTFSLLEVLARLVADVRQLARNRGERDLLEVLAVVSSRLVELSAVAETLPEQDASALPDLTSDLAVRDFEIAFEGDELEERTTRPVERTRRVPRASARRRKAPTAVPWRPVLRGIVAVACAAVSVAASVSVVSQFRAQRRPAAARMIADADLRSVLPGVIVPAAQDASGIARIGVGAEWEDWSDDERRERLMRACEVIGDHSWLGAVFFDLYGRTVATWQRGHITLMRVAPLSS